ncbi:MAG: methionyl-tRNA formyltransferase [Erysipelotrichaceae bacterium]|nr:methionyl-tRNA formyltransferase [Erysipelotrichaceae bacterium]
MIFYAYFCKITTMNDVKQIKILFMGTPIIAASVLEKLILCGYNIVGVISQPDRPVGRKKLLLPTPTKEVALKYNIPCYQVEKIRKDYDFIKEINPDLILTLAYGQIVPKGVLDIPKYGCLNLHGSLLPKYRGAAPIQYALINNDQITGMSLMEMNERMDEGKVYASNIIDILEEDNSTSLFIKMGEAAFELVNDCLAKYINGELPGEEQDPALVSYAPPISKEEEKLNLNDSIDRIYGYIRALSDEPGGYLYLDNEPIKIFKAKIYSREVKAEVGKIIQIDKNGILLQCKDGILFLEELQRQGKKKMGYKDFANGNMALKDRILR